MSEFLMQDYDKFYNECGVAYVIINREGMIQTCNDIAIQLFEKNKMHDLKGKSIIADDVPKYISESIIMLIQKLNKNDDPASLEYKDGEQFFTLVGMHLNELETMIIIKNRSIELQNEKLLLEKLQLETVSHLAAGVAHELRNPLSVIQGFIQLSSVTGNLQNYYETIILEIKRMNAIIDNFLSVSRKTNTKKYIEPKSLLKSVTVLIRSECLLHDIYFDYKLFNYEGYLYVDEGTIKQVMLNLLRNSIEAYEETEKNRVFRLHAGQDNDEFVLMIEDNGPGISEEVIAQLDRPFFTTKDEGTGIGIPLSKKIIKDHGGEFLIEGVPGQGTKVTIRLPLVEYNVSLNELEKREGN